MTSRSMGMSSYASALTCAVVLLAGVVSAQAPGNDTCDQAVTNSFFVFDGSNGGLTNVGATPSGVTSSCGGSGTITPLPLPGVVGDVWYVYTATTSCTMSFSLQNSALVFPIMAIFDGNGFQGPASCGALPELGCTSALSSTGAAVSGEIQLAVNAGDFLLIQISDILSVGGTFSIDINPTLTLSFGAPAGPGSISIENVCGGANAQYITAMDLNQGQTPNGWFFGLDISFTDLVFQVTQGAPFFGVLDATGSSSYTIPFGVPSGVTLYAVTVTLDPVTNVPDLASNVVTYVTL